VPPHRRFSIAQDGPERRYQSAQDRFDTYRLDASHPATVAGFYAVFLAPHFRPDLVLVTFAAASIAAVNSISARTRSWHSEQISRCSSTRSVPYLESRPKA
jgi:hypothetical protein